MLDIKGVKNIEQCKILNNWLSDNFADGSVRAVFIAENHAKVIDQMGHAKPVEIQDGKVIDYNRYYQKRIKEYEDMIKEAIDQQKRATEDVSQTYRRNDFQDLNSKFDTALQSGEEVQRLMNEKTKLRLENLVKTQWDSFLGNDYWIPMEEPRQLSAEYFEHPDIKSVILLYQLDEEARQDIIKDSFYVDNMQYGLPDKFYLGKVNGHNELILGEEVFDHELYHFSKDATNQYEISCSTLKEVAGHIHDYKDVISLTVDEKHLNHEPRQEAEGGNGLYDAAIEEALETAEIPELEMEM